MFGELWVKNIKDLASMKDFGCLSDVNMLQEPIRGGKCIWLQNLPGCV